MEDTEIDILRAQNKALRERVEALEEQLEAVREFLRDADASPGERRSGARA